MSPIVITANTAVESVTPVGPKRKAAQISAGKIRYVSGACELTETAASRATEQIRSTPSTVRIRLHADLGSRSHVRISGRTTSAMPRRFSLYASGYRAG